MSDDVTTREPLLMLVDGWVRETHEPALVPDIRVVVTSALGTKTGLQYFVAPSMILHALRDMVADGLISWSPRGYDVTPEGRQEADEFRARNPDLADRVEGSIKAAVGS